MKSTIGVVLLCAFLTATPAPGADIFIWDNDNNIAFYSAERQAYEYTYQSFERLLTAMGHEVTVGTQLPSDLAKYEAVFALFGFACPG